MFVKRLKKKQKSVILWLPKAIIRDLGLKPEDEVLVFLDRNKRIIIKPIIDPPDDWTGYYK